MDKLDWGGGRGKELKTISIPTESLLSPWSWFGNPSSGMLDYFFLMIMII